MAELQEVTRDSAPIAVVESFLEALRALDNERALAHLAEDIVYQNVPFPPDRGKAQVSRTLRAFGAVTREFQVHTHHIAARGPVVLTERTDIIRGALLDVEIWVCGTFEVRDGKITLW